jgi:signal peptide peptidase-like 2B
MCLCVLFLQVIKLPNLKIASLLLSLAFFYDIFFVFISPLFFEESVMVRVASGKKDAYMNGSLYMHMCKRETHYTINAYI